MMMTLMKKVLNLNRKKTQMKVMRRSLKRKKSEQCSLMTLAQKEKKKLSLTKMAFTKLKNR